MGLGTVMASNDTAAWADFDDVAGDYALVQAVITDRIALEAQLASDMSAKSAEDANVTSTLDAWNAAK